MHKLPTTPGGWNADLSELILIEQTPAPIVLLTTVDTDLQTIATAISNLPSNFPNIRALNLLWLQQQINIDNYASKVLSRAEVIILRLLGGRSYWSYGLEIVKETAAITGANLFVLPGDDGPDPDLISNSNVSLVAANQLWSYFTEGGINNLINALKYVADFALKTNYHPLEPQIVPRLGVYPWRADNFFSNSLDSRVGLIFYRSHYLAGNILPIDAICEALVKRNLEPLPIFISSLRDPEVQTQLLSYLPGIQILLDTTSFSLGKIDRQVGVDLWQKLDVPLLQVIFSSSSAEQWQKSDRGLLPKDVAMNVALPEVDGRIVTRAVSFKSGRNWNSNLETDVVVYQPKLDRIDFICDLAANWVKLRQTPPSNRKIALILANYPNRDGRIANGVGLDTPTSCLRILQALQKEGYRIKELPADGDGAIALLTATVTNDPESRQSRPIEQCLSLEEYRQYFATLPPAARSAISDRWGDLDGKETEFIPIAGVELGNVFVGIQPSRGYDLDPSLNYHAPDLEPTHNYLAYYYWLREKFKAMAIVHVGKHGNLEWLPGKSIALSLDCYPEIASGALPHLYPFIVNDPGEGSQAKRRAQAVIIDHLTPPMTRAELYGPLAKLENLIDEYYEALSLDPSRLKIIGDRITELANTSQLHEDLGLDSPNAKSLEAFLSVADGYLCELKEAQIRDGLHIFGECPRGRQLRDLIVAIARSPSSDRLGLTRAIAKDLNLDFDPLSANLGDSSLAKLPDTRTLGDVVERLEQLACELVENLIESRFPTLPGEATAKELSWIKDTLLPSLQQTDREITNLLKGLDGRYVPSSPAGAPTRGRPEVLPTGRNFYSVDIRAIPTETAWDMGRKAAEAVIERYTQENGEYPQTLAISVWGTSTMRTGGDDIAEVLALLGVRPVWDGPSRRVLDFEILSLFELGRPRVDVTLRISGFFRDSFPNLISLVYNAIAKVASLDEPVEQNPLAARVKLETEFWQTQGLDYPQAKERSLYRIFGSKPGAYGAGLQGTIEAQNWQDDSDLARAYLNWSSYAYDADGKGHAAPEAFIGRLEQLQLILHNQDNREHDLLDSDDYYQFQGGLTVAARALTGKNPQTYFGDNSIPAHPRVRKLSEEIARVYRSRVINPKWIEGVMRHGYKGAFEMSATVDYLFAYDATARCVKDYMYEGVAEAYLFDPKVREFICQKNPWALRDIAERLLEANQRGLWPSASPEIIENLRQTVHQAEGIVEAMG